MNNKTVERRVFDWPFWLWMGGASAVLYSIARQDLLAVFHDGVLGGLPAVMLVIGICKYVARKRWNSCR